MPGQTAGLALYWWQRLITFGVGRLGVNILTFLLLGLISLFLSRRLLCYCRKICGLEYIKYSILIITFYSITRAIAFAEAVVEIELWVNTASCRFFAVIGKFNTEFN